MSLKESFKFSLCGNRRPTLIYFSELDSFFNVAVVGDFPEPEARAYFNKALQQRAASMTLASPLPEPRLGDAEWSRVYAVCGGNAGRLAIVAVSARGGLQPGDLDRGGLCVGDGRALDASPVLSALALPPRKYLRRAKQQQQQHRLWDR